MGPEKFIIGAINFLFVAIVLGVISVVISSDHTSRQALTLGLAAVSGFMFAVSIGLYIQHESYNQ